MDDQAEAAQHHAWAEEIVAELKLFRTDAIIT
jgi:hypothetical protein